MTTTARPQAKPNKINRPRNETLRGRPSRVRMGKFAIVGVLNTVVDFLAFTALVHLTAAPLLVANSTAYLLGVVNSFLFNRAWTFRADGRTGRWLGQLSRFLAVSTVGLAISNAIVVLLGAIVPVLAAKTAAIVGAFIWNYWASRTFVFRPSGGTIDPAGPGAGPAPGRCAR